MFEEAEKADDSKPMLTTSSLLEKSDEDLHRYVISTPDDQLQAVFAEAWESIRQMPFFGGQPTGGATNEALNIARMVAAIARHSGNEALVAEGHRMMAYVLNASEQYEDAILEYVQAIPMLECQRLDQKAARTRLGLVAALFMTGRYAEALKEAERADEWFTRNGDEDGRAKLLANLGNLHHRMDQHAEAVEYHERAIEAFRKLKNIAALAPCFLNLADSLSSLDRFEEADRNFEKSERLCRKFGLTELGFQARYNRAYLSFLRGRYSEAIQNFGELRRHFNEKGSKRHSALCDLDESEIYLHLNLASEALNLSRRAADTFNALGMKYEEAKARAFAGIGLTNGNQPADALPVLSNSQAIFEQEENLYWVASIELYRAQILSVMGRQWEAQALATSANTRFSSLSIPSKQAIALTLLARISLELGNIESANGYAEKIMRLIGETPIPLHVFPCYFIIAKVSEHMGDLTKAYEFYKRAAGEIEVHRGYIHYDELRVTFLKGKQQVYEALVRLALVTGDPKDGTAEAYGWCAWWTCCHSTVRPYNLTAISRCCVACSTCTRN
jgi:tetratricopeptide (TPR) repeat protein